MKVLTAGSHVTVSMLWRSTMQMVITGGTALPSRVLNSPCTPMPLMQEQWEARFMCVDTTKEQVMKQTHKLKMMFE